MIIIDNSIISFANNLSNGIYVPSYFGEEDYCLRDVMELLKEISSSKDVTKELDRRIGLKEMYIKYTHE